MEEESITQRGKWAMTKKEESEGQMKQLAAAEGSKNEITNMTSLITKRNIHLMKKFFLLQKSKG